MNQPTKQSGKDGSDWLLITDQDLLSEQGALFLENVQQLAGIGTLTTGIAQELANLLSIITAASDSLRNELQTVRNTNGSAVQHYMNLIERNTFRCAQIVALLQEFGSFQEPQMAITDIDAILRDTTLLVERQFREENNVEILVSKPLESRSLVCDHNRIVQLLVILLINARNAMPETGGSIEIEVCSLQCDSREDLADLMLAAAEDQIAILITDAAAPVLPAMWEPINDDGSGAGLGLRFARVIAGQHNGHIWINNDSDPDKGAAVTVILPARLSL